MKFGFNGLDLTTLFKKASKSPPGDVSGVTSKKDTLSTLGWNSLFPLPKKKKKSDLNLNKSLDVRCKLTV